MLPDIIIPLSVWEIVPNLVVGRVSTTGFLSVPMWQSIPSRRFTRRTLTGTLIVGGARPILIPDAGPASSVIARTLLPGSHSMPRSPPGTGTGVPKNPLVPVGGMNVSGSVLVSMVPRISSDSCSGTLKPFMLRLPLRAWTSMHPCSTIAGLALHPDVLGNAA